MDFFIGFILRYTHTCNPFTWKVVSMLLCICEAFCNLVKRDDYVLYTNYDVSLTDAFLLVFGQKWISTAIKEYVLLQYPTPVNILTF